MKIMVTGATGFIGRQLCLSLAQQGHTVHALCRNVHHPLLIQHENIVPFKGNILDRQTLHQAMDGCSQVYHTAALAKMWSRNKHDFYRINVTGTVNVMNTAKQHHIAKVVHTSSCGVLGPTIKHPMTEKDPRIVGFPIHYERTKYLADNEVLKFVENGLPVVIVMPSRVYGDGPVTDSNTVGKMVSGYLKGTWRFIPGDGSQVANYVYLQDVVNGHIAAMESGVSGERYILGGEDISFNRFFEVVSSVSHTHHRLFHLPVRIIKAFSYFEAVKTKLTGLPPFFLPEFADRLTMSQKYSSEKAIGQLGYTITPFEEGIRRTIDYLKTQHHAEIKRFDHRGK